MWPVIFSSLVGLLGVLAGAFMVRGNDTARRQLEFIEKQLRNLYSPLHSLRQEIRALSELRLKIERASNATWQELCADRPSGEQPDFAPYAKIIVYFTRLTKTLPAGRVPSPFVRWDKNALGRLRNLFRFP